MLIVTRKRGQAILIGHNIEIHVRRIRRDAIKLAIRAPMSLRVRRLETMRPSADAVTITAHDTAST